MTNPTLTLEQAYLSMYDYFDVLYQRTKLAEQESLTADIELLPDTLYQHTKTVQLGKLLDYMRLSPDGGTLDPAAWNDWLKSVQRAIDNEVDARQTLSNTPPGE